PPFVGKISGQKKRGPPSLRGDPDAGNREGGSINRAESLMRRDGVRAVPQPRQAGHDRGKGAVPRELGADGSTSVLVSQAPKRKKKPPTRSGWKLMYFLPTLSHSESG